MLVMFIPLVLLFVYMGLAGSVEWWPPVRLAAFGSGLALIGAGAVLSDSALPTHMVAHGLIVTVGAALLVLGRPITLILKVLSPARGRQVVRLLRRPWVSFLVWPPFAFGFFITVQFLFHLTPLFELALTNEVIHELEHALFLSSALLFWTAALAVEPLPHRWSPSARALFLLAAMPLSDIGAIRLMLIGEETAGAAMVGAMMPLGLAAIAILWSGLRAEEQSALKREALDARI